MKRLIRLPESPERNRREIDAELTFHVQGRIEELVAAGMSRPDAEREAMRRFGDRTRVEAEVERIDAVTARRSRWRDHIADLGRDLTYAARGLARRPLYATAVMLTLALGVGANAAVYSVVRAVLIRPFNVPAIDRLAVVRNDYPLMGLRNTAVSPLEVLDLIERKDLFTSGTGIGGDGSTIEISGVPTRTSGATTIGEFFGTFGVRPMLGRLYGPEDSQVGRAPVVVLSHKLWQQLSGDSAFVGRSLLISDRSYEVIGVLPPDFAYPRTAQYWRPMVLDSVLLNQQQSRGTLITNFVGRMRDGLTVERLGGEVRALADRWNELYGPASARGGHTMLAHSFVTYTAGELRPIVIALFVAVSLVLLLACANVASLQLVRAAGRARELAVRAALGAGRGAITRALLVEGALLTLGGAVVGVVLARGGLAWLTQLNVTQFPALAGLTLDGPVLAFTALVAVATGLLTSLAPGLRVVRGDVNQSLRESGRGSSAGAARHRLLRASVVLQNALTLLLLVGATLTLRSLDRLLAVDPGFDADQVTSFSIALPRTQYADGPARVTFFRTLQERLQAIPGVQSVGFALGVPFTGAAGSTLYNLPGVGMRDGEPQRHADQAFVFGDFFRTMGIDIVRGRGFGEEEYGAGLPTYVVDETLVKQSFGTADPIGATIEHGPPGTIIGVARSVKLASLAEEGHPLIYHNFTYRAGEIGALTAVLRSTLPTEQVVTAARAAVAELDRSLALANPGRLRERVESTLGPRRLATGVLGGFAALSLVLAILGVYAVMSHVVSDRTREIGIRSALGAPRSGIVGMVVGDGARLAAIGLVLGGIGLAAGSRLMRGLLFGVRPFDVASLAAGIVLLGIATIVACYLPTWRALRVEPTVALKGE